MSKLKNDIVLTSRVRLARNYFDLPFSNATHPENAQLCITRAKEAFEEMSPPDTYKLYSLSTLPENEKTALMEQHLISRDLLQNSPFSAVLVQNDQRISIMVNEEDHLRIQVIQTGLLLSKAVEAAFETEAKLQNVCSFSFDNQLGYLTACPTNTGTGMRASLMLHLPILTRCKQMGNVSQSVAKLGLTIRGIYGEGSDAQGDLYQVSNQVTLGRTEEEIIEAVNAVGNQLIDMENGLRQRAAKEALFDLEDRIFRSYGLLRYARQIRAEEFMEHWSNLRLGVSLKLLPVTFATADTLLTTAQNAHAALYCDRQSHKLTVNQARAEIIRTALNPKIQEG